MSKRLSRSAFRAIRERVTRAAGAIERMQREEQERIEAERAARVEQARLERERAEARYAGAEAKRNGVTAAKNPHPAGSSHRKAWAEGWLEEHARTSGRRRAA